MEIIDADGHVNDGAGQAEIAKYMPAGNRSSQVFPTLDHLHFHYLRPEANRSGLENPGPDEWVRFLDETGISCSVLYPTFGLAVGRFVSEHWAIAACRAYNNWLHEKFTSKNSRLKGMALIPIQDVEASVAELRRAVKELGMLGGMLPSNGEGIKDHLGARLYWPLYEEAEKLGCALAVHVGSLNHLGMDGFSTYYPVHALGHPFGIAIQAAGLLAHGIFEKFPKLRVAFSRGRIDLGAVFLGPARPFLSSGSFAGRFAGPARWRAEGWGEGERLFAAANPRRKNVCWLRRR